MLSNAPLLLGTAPPLLWLTTLNLPTARAGSVVVDKAPLLLGDAPPLLRLTTLDPIRQAGMDPLLLGKASLLLGNVVRSDRILWDRNS